MIIVPTPMRRILLDGCTRCPTHVRRMVSLVTAFSLDTYCISGVGNISVKWFLSISISGFVVQNRLVIAYIVLRYFLFLDFFFFKAPLSIDTVL
jgi:hypothetical protein